MKLDSPQNLRTQHTQASTHIHDNTVMLKHFGRMKMVILKHLVRRRTVMSKHLGRMRMVMSKHLGRRMTVMSAAHSPSNWAFFFIMKRAMPETTMTSNACVIGRGAETKWLYESCTVRQHSPDTMFVCQRKTHVGICGICDVLLRLTPQLVCFSPCAT